MTVRLLDEALINQIAAGEVVERPASVVKELLENALDAGARTVTVTLRGGGRQLVRVTDDGSGMDRNDALMSLERHATSKIRSMDDLVTVGSLGFRGEAIPSIASVSRFQLVTRPHEAEVGTRIDIEGGRMLDVRDAGCAAGTEIDVRQLFFNVPARRKFLRTAQTELQHCVEAVLREALVRPDVDFRVGHEGRELLRAPAAEDRAGRAKAVLGEDAARLVPLAFADRGVEVEALASPPGVHRSSSTGSTYLYVNGRFVRDPVVRRGVSDAYRDLLPRGRHPLVVLEVRMDPRLVDVNVHPSKTEVRFRNPRDLVGLIADGLRAGLLETGIDRPASSRVAPRILERRGPSLPLGQRYQPPPATRPPESRPPVTRPPLSPHPDDHPGLAVPPPPAAPAPAHVAEPAPVSEPRFRAMRLVGTFHRFVLCEDRGELVVVDARAARERLVRARLARDRENGSARSRRLLTPLAVDLPPADAERLARQLADLEALGLSVERFGPASFAVRAAPEALDEVDLDALVRDLGAAGGGELADRMARHVRLDPLDAYEARALLAALDEAEVAPDDETVTARVPPGELWRRLS